MEKDVYWSAFTLNSHSGKHPYSGKHLSTCLTLNTCFGPSEVKDLITFQIMMDIKPKDINMNGFWIQALHFSRLKYTRTDMYIHIYIHPHTDTYTERSVSKLSQNMGN